MDLRLMLTTPTSAERSAVDALLGAAPSGWVGGARSPADHHVAFGGFPDATANRPLLLPALQAVQSAIGWVSPGALNYVCQRLSVPPAEAYAVASFYALLATEERPARVAHVCEDVSCRARGGLQLFEALAGRDDVLPSSCLGQCDRSPAVLVQRAGEADVSLWKATPETVIDVLDGATPIEPEPRHFGVPQSETGSDGLRLLRRVGAIDPYSLDDYRATGGYEAFARALEKEKVAFIGPGIKAIAAMGDKIESKKLAQEAGVSTVPGHMGILKDGKVVRVLINNSTINHASCSINLFWKYNSYF